MIERLEEDGSDSYDWEHSLETAIAPDRGEDKELAEILEEYGMAHLLANYERAVKEGVERRLESSREEDFLEYIREFLVLIIDSANPALEADCIALAIGLPLRGNATLEEVGNHHGVKKQYVCRRRKRIRLMLGLSKVAGQKSDAACDKYKQTNYRKGKI